MNMTLKSELVALMDRDGILRAPDCLDWAQRHPKSELHRHLEWDDSKAGHAYRLWQIRSLIALHIVTPQQERKTISLSIDRVLPGGGYRDLDTVMRDEILREIALSDALADLERCRKRYEGLAELQGVWRALERVVKKQEDNETGKARRSQAGPSTAWQSTAELSKAKQA
jgi:hypothetical protein